MAVLGYAAPQTYLMFCVTRFHMDAGAVLYVSYLVLCNIAFHAGYRYRRSIRINRVRTEVNETRFLQVTYAAAIISFIGWVLWYRQASAFSGRHWNSSLVYLYTLASQSRPAFTFSLCAIAFCRKKRLAIIPLLITLIPLTHFVVIGRRSAIFYIAVNLLFLATYILRRKLPAKLIALAVPLGIFAFLLVPVYREAFPQGISAVQKRLEEKPITDALGDFMGGNRTIEYYHASRAMYASYQANEYSYGAGFWNALVFQYVPGGLIGRDNKESLMIPEPQLRRLIILEYRDASLHRTYLALGGYQDSFQQFSFAGCFVFAIFAYAYHGVEQSALIKKQQILPGDANAMRNIASYFALFFRSQN